MLKITNSGTSVTHVALVASVTASSGRKPHESSTLAIPTATNSPKTSPVTTQTRPTRAHPPPPPPPLGAIDTPAHPNRNEPTAGQGIKAPSTPRPGRGNSQHTGSAADP